MINSIKGKIKNQKGFIKIPLLILVIISVLLISMGSYGGFEYYKISKVIKESKQLVEEEKYNEAIQKLERVRNSFTVKSLGLKRQEINDEIEINKRNFKDKSKFNQALTKIDEGNYQEAIKLLYQINESSFYYQKAQTKMEEAKRKVVEEQLKETKSAKERAEQKAQEEAIKRSQEEMLRKEKELELAEKEAKEKMMNTDNDGDGLTYRRELELGTSDWNTDSDGDGIKDSEDAHPAGGGRYIAQHFEWEYEGKIWEWNYSIHEDWYEYYKNKPRSPHGTEYVTLDDPFIKKIAKALKETADRENYHLTSFIVSFVQSLPYVKDAYTSFDEYPKYPIETFVEGNGDCEDTSYLFASIVQATNIGTALIQFHNHMGVGVKTIHSQSGYYYPIGNDWYYYYETTGKRWQVGELPKDYLHEKAKIIRVWDSSVHYAYPGYIKPCYALTDFPGYYSDGEKFYSDSQCNHIVYCVPYKGFYVNPQVKTKLYWDSSCSQEVTIGCYKSDIYPGYFYDDAFEYYSDSRCTLKARLCRPSSNYSDTYYDGYNEYWDSNCTQKVLPWCLKSTYHPGYFLNTLDYKYYYDSQCTQEANL